MSMDMEESLTVKSITTMMSTEVTHAGTPSVIHIRAAKAKMEIMRCSMTVMFGMPKQAEGRFHSNNDKISTAVILIKRTTSN